jgi:TonB family protein
MRSCRRALLCALVVSIACAGSAAAQRNRRAPSAADQAAPAASDAPKESAGKLEGSVVLEFTIATDGTTKDIVVVESSPPGVFDDAAVKALARWRYNPKIEDGQPVERRGVRTRIVFQLED